jgi:hypothetical protein
MRRGRVCPLQLMLFLAGAFIPGSAGLMTTCYASNSRLPQPGEPGPLIYILEEQADPVIPPGIGFLFRCF